MAYQHFKIFKPYGYLSQFTNNQNTRRNKKLLGELHDFPPGTMAIGRLDETSEGLLLLTTNGIISEQVRSKKVEKEYYVQVDGLITAKAVKKLQSGIEISINGRNYTTLPCKVGVLPYPPSFPERGKKIRDERHGPTSWISITLVEGKYRQVRKMTAAVGFPTLRLVRVRIGEETLEKLLPGEMKNVKNFLL
ncbi:pseudouridine synthase [Antarcticibacterium flavum]|uniref:Pseudouridine synthase n=1 Tax=Antarcticibacterium flavum TaxID=2058175 RepID=A0A5B7WZR0_9FLAO|nr:MULTISPECIES: pseudouridine synthase [Antarcticibacterium]MCM4158716.1 pseudouridine synthase [Antarcticibacterium sp. W02-3]QCY68569.1 pseudouridine synthase [Antarcticibacterium flavum]